MLRLVTLSLLFLFAGAFAPLQALAQGRGRPQPLPDCGPLGCPCFYGDDYQVFTENGKVGFKNTRGKVVLAAQFEQTLGFSEGYAPVKLDGLWGMIAPDGSWHEPASWNFLSQYHEGLAAARLRAGGELRVLDRNKTLDLPKRFAGLKEYREGVCGATTDGKTWGLIDFRGAWVIEPAFEDIGECSEGLFAFKQGGKWGYMTRRREIVLAPQYDAAEPFATGSAPVMQNNKTREISKSGKPAPAELVAMKALAKGKVWPARCRIYPHLAGAFREAGKIGFRNAEGQIIIPPELEETDGSYEGLTRAKRNGKWGMLDYRGNWVIEPKFAYLGRCSEGLIAAQPEAEGKFGAVNREGSFVVAAEHDYVDAFREGLARARGEGEALGLIDVRGNWIMPAKYLKMGEYSEGYVSFTSAQNKRGYLNFQGEVVIEPQYFSGQSFAAGTVVVTPTDSGAIIIIDRDARKVK